MFSTHARARSILNNSKGTIYMVSTIKSIQWTLLNSTSVKQVILNNWHNEFNSLGKSASCGTFFPGEDEDLTPKRTHNKYLRM